MALTSLYMRLSVLVLTLFSFSIILSLFRICLIEEGMLRSTSQAHETAPNLLFDNETGTNAQCQPRHSFSSSVPTEGVLYFAYQSDPEAREKIIGNMVASIKSLRQHNPCLKVAVATNAPVTEKVLASWNANDLIIINDNDLIRDASGEPVRQWWTRTLYLPRSPYDRTIQIDSDRTICGDISEVFQHLDIYDFLQVPVGYMPTCDNGIMAWRKGQAFDRLLEEWKEEMAKTGGVGDDQAPLGRIIDTVPDLKVGILSPVYQMKIMPAVGQGFASMQAGQTLVMHGWAKIVAGAEKLCERANEGAPRPRILVMDLDRKWSTAFSLEDCQTLLNGTCAQNEQDWDLNFNVMSRPAYLKRSLGKAECRG